jgi:hypothetical protein
LILHKKSLLTDASLAAAILIANLLILGPYVLTAFTDQPWNNGYFYIASARLFRDFKWTWNPLTYAGAPLPYMYPPLFHFLLGALPVSSLGRAYHLLTAAAYALTPVCIYILGRVLFRSRPLAVFAAVLCTAFPSPAYYFLPQWRNLTAPYAHAPWGFVALVGYEEAAHGFAFPIALLAVAAAWRTRWTLAALLTAAVCLTSWPAMLGLGIMLTAVAAAKTHDAGFRKSLLAIFGIVGVAYGLAAFWITPGYMLSTSLGNRVVLRHAGLIPTLPEAPWNRTTWIILCTAAVVLALSLWRCIAPELAFLLAWLAVAGAIVLAFTLARNSLLPISNRYMLEFSAGLVMAVAGLIWLLRKWRVAAAVAALAILGAGAPAAFGFVSHAWKVQPHAADPAGTIVYQLAGWLNRHAGHARIMASGELNSELFLWSDVPQAGGVPAQDISNYLIFAAQRQVAFGCESDSERIAELWLRALNIRYLVVHGSGSREYFHWFTQPEKFAALPVAWDNGAGDTIYEAPGFDEHDAVVVDLPAMARLPHLTSTGDAAFLAAYVAWAAGKRPASIRWTAPDSAVVDAQLGPDEAVLVKINHDRGWRAPGATTASDPIGFLLLRAGPDQQRLALEFGAAWDVWLGRALTLLTIVLLLLRVPKPWIAALAVLPAVAAFGLLASNLPPTVAVAEAAFIRLQPPLISPGGIVDSATYLPPPFARGRTITAWGLNLGSSTDSASLWLGGRNAERKAEIVARTPNTITFKLPPDADAKTVVSVEVNACRGNAFTVETR